MKAKSTVDRPETIITIVISNMSSHRILITGASGYLGGTLLARLKDADLPPYEKLYALVRSDSQAEAVGQYGAEALRLDLEDEEDVRRGIVDNKITIVYFLVDAMKADAQVYFIKALAGIKEATGREVHFLHVSLNYERWWRSRDQRLMIKIMISRPAAPSSSLLTRRRPQTGRC